MLMDTMKFKTDIKCSGCVAKVTPFLNEAVGVDHWQVDTSNPSKVLAITNNTSEAEVKAAVAKAGFKAERI
jgi:copper chaperone